MCRINFFFVKFLELELIKIIEKLNREVLMGKVGRFEWCKGWIR